MKKTTIAISGEYIKLSQLLKFAGASPSGGEAGEMINEGLVKLNGEICVMRGKKVRAGDTVKLADGTELLVTGKEE
jgi:ribosome-associated protein